MLWQQRAKMIYGGTQWERGAIAAGTSMDNQLNGKDAKHDVFGVIEGCPRSHFDVRTWLAWFDTVVMKARGVEDKYYTQQK